MKKMQTSACLAYMCWLGAYSAYALNIVEKEALIDPTAEVIQLEDEPSLLLVLLFAVEDSDATQEEIIAIAGRMFEGYRVSPPSFLDLVTLWLSSVLNGFAPQISEEAAARAIVRLSFEIPELRGVVNDIYVDLDNIDDHVTAVDPYELLNKDMIALSKKAKPYILDVANIAPWVNVVIRSMWSSSVR